LLKQIMLQGQGVCCCGCQQACQTGTRQLHGSAERAVEKQIANLATVAVLQMSAAKAVAHVVHVAITRERLFSRSIVKPFKPPLGHAGCGGVMGAWAHVTT